MFGASLKFLVMSVFVLGLSGCADDDVSRLAEAQDCLDSATVSTAESCMSKVSGLESSQSYMIRCSIRFLMASFDTERFVDAFEALSNDSGGDTTLKALAIFKFDSRPEMDTTLSDCNRSESPGMMGLARISDLATYIVTDIGGGTFDDIYNPETGEVDQTKLDDLKTDLAGVADSATDAELGEKAKSMSEIFCSTEEKSNTEMCKDLNDALAGATTNEEIGAALRGLLN